MAHPIVIHCEDDAFRKFKEKLDSHSFVQVNADWTVTQDLTCSDITIPYGDSGMSYNMIECAMYMRRQPYHYIINFAVPFFTVSFLAVLGQHAAASVGGPRTNKFHLVLNTLMSMSVLVSAMLTSMPKSAEISRLQRYANCCSGVVCASCISNWVMVEIDIHTKNCKQLKKIDILSAVVYLSSLVAALAWFLYPMIEQV